MCSTIPKLTRPVPKLVTSIPGQKIIFAKKRKKITLFSTCGPSAGSLQGWCDPLPSLQIPMENPSMGFANKDFEIRKLKVNLREVCKKSKWKFKMAFAREGGGSRGGLECHIPILKNDFC